MSCIDVSAADDLFALCFKGINLIQEAIIESELELNEVIASSAVGEIYIEEDKIPEIRLYYTAFVIELLDSEAEFNALGFGLRIKRGTRVSFALGRIEPALISGDIRDLRS